MAKRKRRLIFLLAGAVLAVGSLGMHMPREPEKENRHGRHGLYSWNAIETEEELDALLQAVQKASVGEIYQYYRESELQDRVPQKLITRLSENKVDVWYVTGEPEWGLDETGEEIRRAISMVALYNLLVPEEAKFAGIQLDVEPYLTDGWEENRQEIMELWYKALYRGKTLAKDYGIRVMICVPRWMDAVNSDVFEQMLRDCCDEVAIMNYDRRDEVEGIKAEMELARRYDRPVVCVSELGEPGRHGLTEDHTYYEAGLDELYEAWQRISEAYPRQDLRFAYHHIVPLKELLER